MNRRCAEVEIPVDWGAPGGDLVKLKRGAGRSSGERECKGEKDRARWKEENKRIRGREREREREKRERGERRIKEEERIEGW